MVKPKTSGIVTHITGGLIFLSLPLLFLSGGDRDIFPILLSSFYWLFFLFYAFLFYINTYFLIPELYFKKKTVLYISILLLLFLIVFLLQPFDHLISNTMQPGPNNRPPPSFDDRPPRLPNGPFNERRVSPHIDIVSIFLFVMILALSFAVQNTWRWRVTAQRAAKAETEKAQAELSFLKAQINPHFLFNTLNNIYSLAITGNEHTADSIMKLSNIMRYVTDDVTEDLVPLQSEADCIANYIDLQRLRLGKKTAVEWSVSGNLNKTIPPLLLMTFVENAFKYGVSNRESTDILVQLAADEYSIHFYCSNKIVQGFQQPERTGIGISNTRRRLQHLYPDKHILTITNANDTFTVELTIQV
jgi:two-component system, LytTR family, sensor kinase